jgi:hypothetical protein
MKYTFWNAINKPLAEVIEKFKDPEGAKQWMEGLKTIERVSGTPGEDGARTNFIFLHRNKEMTIKETIIEQNFPNQIKFAYQSSMGYNEVEMIFEAIDENTVRQTNNSYFQLKGFMIIMGVLLKGMFKKQSLTYSTALKIMLKRND